jgi:thiamine pyrophosphate-dependent acetolactate synthase large subunit-like protein
MTRPRRAAGRPPVPGPTGRFALLEQFIADGVEYMFGNPGTVEQGFLDALSDYPELKYILTLQESIAVLVADGYARATKKPTLVQIHSTPGVGNAVGNMYQAKRGGAPLVVIAGEAGVRYDAMDAQMAGDLVAMMKPVTKWATRVVDPESTLRVIRRAIKIAATAPTGPVFVALPADVLDAPRREDVVPTSFPVTRVLPRQDKIQEAASILAGAQRPLIIMGDGVAMSGAQAELAQVAELIGADVWGANSSEVNIPFDHPLYRGGLGHMFGSFSQPITSQADVVLIVGTYVFPEVFPALSAVFAPGSQVIHIDLDSYEIAKNFPVDLGLAADPKATLREVAIAVEQLQTPQQREAGAARLKQIGATTSRAREAAKEADRANWDAVPMRPAQFMATLAEKLPDDAIIFDEALTGSGDLTRYVVPRKPGTFFQTRGGSLGVGIPGTIGVKLANPDKTVVGFTGDGGSMYTIQALWTAAHHKVGAKFVVCNNHSYKLLKLNVQQYWRDNRLPERDFPNPFDIKDPDLDFVGLAKAMGVPGIKVERPEQIAGAIDEMLATDGPFLIDLVLSDDVPAHFVYHKGGQ